MGSKVLVTASVVAILAGGFTRPAVAAGPVSGSTVDPSGLEIVGPAVIQVDAIPAGMKTSFDAAFTLANDHPEDFGYPWVDANSAGVRVLPTNANGRAEAQASLGQLASETVGANYAGASVADLSRLADALTRLNGTGFADAALIWKTEPDELNNRIIVTVGAATPGLMSALASRFGVRLLAVRVEPVPNAGSTNRDSDAPLFWGGAKIGVPAGGCTTGFAWNAGSPGAMVLAGHCAPTGGNVGYTNYPNVGTVKSGSEENWSSTTGTEYFPGQTVYRGDAALIRYSTYGTAAVVYDGAIHTSTNSPVGNIHSSWSLVGDRVCENGAYGGEACGVVASTGVDIWYNNDGPSVWARHVVDVIPDYSCPIPGDSGAPVYKRLSSGKLEAWGVQSGTKTVLFACDFLYTDIWDVFYGLPGNLKTQ